MLSTQLLERRYTSKSPLNDNPVSNGLTWNPLKISAACGLFAACSTRSIFAVSRFVDKLKFLQRLPANQTSIVVGGAMTGVGFMYGTNREFVKILQPNRAVVPEIIKSFLDEPVYKEQQQTADPRIQMIFRLITNNILQQEVWKKNNFFF